MWSHSTRLLAYRSVRCHAAGSSSYSTARYTVAWIGGDLDGRDLGRADRPLEEPVGSLGVLARRDEHVDDLPELVDRPVDVAPVAADPHVSVVRKLSVPDGVTAWLGGVGQQRRKAQHSPVDGEVVDLHTPLGDQLLDVAVGKPEAQVPADRDDDDVGWEAEAGEGGAGDCSGVAGTATC
jgi:hypothetical protein